MAYAKPEMPLAGLAQKVVIPLNSGLTAKFTRPLRMAKITTASTAGEGVALTPLAVTAQTKSVTVAEWENAISVGTLLDDSFINPVLSGWMEILGINAGQSMELELQKTLGGETILVDTAGIMPLVYDVSQVTTNNKSGTATHTGVTTNLRDTTVLTQAADYWVGGYIAFTNPEEKNYGLSRKVLAFDATSDIVWWTTAVAVATTTATTYVIGSPGATSSLTTGTDVLCADALRRGVRLLRKQSALPIQGGYFVMPVDPDNEYHLTGETAAGGFIDIHKYVDNTILLEGEIGKVGGVRMVRETTPFELSATALNYEQVAGGALTMNFLLGRDCLGKCGLSGTSDTQIIVKRPGAQTTSDPSNKFSTAAWKTTFARLSLNACWGVGIITAPSK